MPIYGYGLPTVPQSAHQIHQYGVPVIMATPSLHLPAQHIMCDPSDHQTWTEPMLFTQEYTSPIASHSGYFTSGT